MMAKPSLWQDGADPHLRTRLRRFEDERTSLLRRAHSVLAADPRVVAVWLFGSLGRADADELSDIDLFVINTDEHHDLIVADRPAFIAQLDDPLLILEAPQNWPPGGVYNMALYPGEDGPHQVDWYWVRHSVAAIPSETMVLFDHVTLPRLATPTHFTYQPVPPRPPQEVATQEVNMFWAMLLITAKYIARSPWDEVLAPPVGSLQEVANFAGVTLPEGVLRPPAPESPLLRIDHLRQLGAAMEALAAPVAARGAHPPREFAPHAARYLDFVEALVRDRLRLSSSTV